jgi:hypothetical protein
VGVFARLGTTVERLHQTFEEAPLCSSMEKHREVLPLHASEHKQAGLAVREDGKI